MARIDICDLQKTLKEVIQYNSFHWESDASFRKDADSIAAMFVVVRRALDYVDYQNSLTLDGWSPCWDKQFRALAEALEPFQLEEK